MTTHKQYFGPSIEDFRTSLFRKSSDESLSLLDAVRFFDENADSVFLLADGIVQNDGGTDLFSFTSMLGDAEYVMTYDVDTAAWTLVTSQWRKKPPIVSHVNRALS